MRGEDVDILRPDLDLWQECFGKWEGRMFGPKWLVPIRKSALAHFSQKGFPTTKDEDWRFTDLSPIRDLPFKPALDHIHIDDSSDLHNVRSRSLIADVETLKIVFVDGFFNAVLSDSLPLSENIRVSNIRSAFNVEDQSLQEHFAKSSQKSLNAFSALNTAYFADGARIRIGRNVAVKPILHLIFFSTGREEGLAIHPRNVFTIGQGSSLTIVEEYIGLEGALPTLTNAITEFEIGENAFVEHIKLQDESSSNYHIAGVEARLDRDCRFRSHSFALGAMISRNDIRMNLAGKGAQCVLNGLYLTKGRQLADHHMIVKHASAHCESHEYFNGILDDHSRGIFHGRILVCPFAQKTDAKQTNKNLLLSDEAKVNTKPQLEIYADDVKCTHGATIGQMDEAAIFYLRARGVPESLARRMLIHAFADEIVERIDASSIAKQLSEVLWGRLEV